MTITRFRDDYKPRGDWSSTSPPAIFRSDEKARTHLRQRLLSELEFYYEFEAYKDKLSPYERACFDKGRVRREYRKDAQLIKRIFKKAMEGEFVPTKCSYDILPVDLQDERTVSSDEESESEEEEAKEGDDAIENETLAQAFKRSQDEKEWKAIAVTDVYHQYKDCLFSADTCWYPGNMDRLDGLQLFKLKGTDLVMCDVCMGNGKLGADAVYQALQGEPTGSDDEEEEPPLPKSTFVADITAANKKLIDSLSAIDPTTHKGMIETLTAINKHALDPSPREEEAPPSKKAKTTSSESVE